MKLVLIDYENVQPETINILLPEESFVVVCVGGKTENVTVRVSKIANSFWTELSNY